MSALLSSMTSTEGEVNHASQLATSVISVEFFLDCDNYKRVLLCEDLTYTPEES